MLKWCSYCQQFMHEIAPYDDFGVTHGLCATCESSHEDLFSREEIERSLFLQKIFRTLFDAGRNDDFEASCRIVETAIDANCRPVDILMGMIAPMLFEIGEQWKRGALSVEAEHRFTAFSENVIQLIETRIGAVRKPPVRSDAPLLFLMNAPGNRHNLAMRILTTWLKGRGPKLRIIEEGANQDTLLRSIVLERPKYLLISMSLTEQYDRVAEIARTVRALPRDVRPQTIVGGYPIKAGLVSSIPETELLVNISALKIA
jgi:methanogenic corrinoid protein MtbC1